MMPTATASEASERSVLDTYRYLRGGMAVMVVMLAAGVIGESLAANCWLGSISAYYYTAAHSVFVAALCAIGVLLIAYRGGTDTEDNLLNLAGILAFIVAFVPTTQPAAACGVDGSIIRSHDAVVNNVWAFVIALVVARAVFWWLYRVTGTKRSKRSALGWVTTVVLWLVVTIGIASFVFLPAEFDERAHYLSAILLFGAIIITVVISAVFAAGQDPDLAPRKRIYFLSYLFLAAAMVGTATAVIGTHLLLQDWGHWVISVEALLILEFAAYWMIQTIELWNVRSSAELLPPTLREDAAHACDGATPRKLPEEIRELRDYPPNRRLMRAL
jgi:hypothetical protein